MPKTPRPLIEGVIARYRGPNDPGCIDAEFVRLKTGIYEDRVKWLCLAAKSSDPGIRKSARKELFKRFRVKYIDPEEYNGKT